MSSYKLEKTGIFAELVHFSPLPGRDVSQPSGSHFIVQMSIELAIFADQGSESGLVLRSHVVRTHSSGQPSAGLRLDTVQVGLDPL